MGIFTKVKEVQASGTFESKFGLLYKFDYVMENGVVLGANHKTVTGFFAEGSPVEYTIKGNNDYGNYGTVGKPEETNTTGFPNPNLNKPHEKANRDNVQKYIVRQSSLKIALDHLQTVPDGLTKENVIALAEYYTDYVFQGL